MSSEFQNRVRKNLEQALPAQHLSADVLSAYAEHALSAREEKEVVAHLAVCADCREIVYLAAETEEEPATPVSTLPEPRRLRWWTWALPVTAVLVVASVFLVQGPLLKESPKSELAKPLARTESQPQPNDQLVAKTAPATPTMESKAAAPKPQSRIEAYAAPAAAPTERKQAAQPSSNGDLDAVPSSIPRRESRQKEDEAPPLSIAGGTPQNAPAAPPPSPLVALEKDKKVEAQANNYNASAPAASTTVDVTSAQPQVETNEVARSRDLQDHYALKSAKQRSDTANKTDALQKASGMAAANFVAPAWSINPQGQLQHLINGTIQEVPIDPAAHFLVVAAAGTNLWVAGKNLVLYHSVDNGATWQRQTIPASTPADIVRIQSTSASDVTLTTGTSQTFTTHDAGQTWIFTPQ